MGANGGHGDAEGPGDALFRVGQVIDPGQGVER